MNPPVKNLYRRLEIGFLPPEFEEDDVPGSSSESQQPIVRTHSQLLDGEVLFARLRHDTSHGRIGIRPDALVCRTSTTAGCGPNRRPLSLVKDFARLEPVEDLKREGRSVPELDRSVRVPRDDELRVTGGHTAPLSPANGPLPLAEARVALSTDRVEGRDEVPRTVGDVQAARDGRLVDIHRIRVLEARKARREQVDDHQVVLEQHDDGVRVLSFCTDNNSL